MVRRSLGLWIVLSSAGCTLFTDVDDLGSGATSVASSTVGSGGQGGDATTTSAAVTTSGSGGNGGSDAPPGDCVPDGYHGLRLNELAPEGEPDWIEIKNCGTEPVELCGVMLVEEFNGSMPPAASSYALEGGTLEPGAFLMLVRYEHFEFGLSKDNDQRFSLVSPTLELIDESEWPESVLPFGSAETWSRQDDCVGSFVKAAPTPGAPNG